jgi:hypothetical protein
MINAFVLKPNLSLERSLWFSFLKKLMQSEVNQTLKILQGVTREMINSESLLFSEISITTSSFGNPRIFILVYTTDIWFLIIQWQCGRN